MPQYTFPKAFTQRFWSHVHMPSADECWPWSLSRGNHGYGQVSYQRTMHLTHRIAYEMTHGPIPDGLWVLHSCDNPPCCNPKHMFLGTHTDNMRDMTAKGRNGVHRHPERYPRGDSHPSRTMPERLSRGDNHYTRQHPEKVMRGELNGRARFTEQNIRDMRQQHEQGIAIRELARRYKADRKTIQAIVKHRIWRHIE